MAGGSDAALRRDARDGGSSLLSGDQLVVQPQRAPRREQTALPEPVAGVAIGASDRDASASVDRVEVASAGSVLASTAERAKAVSADLFLEAEAEAVADAETEIESLSVRKSAPLDSLLQSAPKQDAEMADESGPRALSRPTPVAVSGSVSPPPPIRTFESELDPFRFNLLDSGHFVLFRWAWRDGTRTVQGALIQPDAFLSALIGDAFRASALQRAVSLHLAWGDRPLSIYGAVTDRYERSRAGALPDGTVVNRGRLQEPFGALRLVVEVARLQARLGGLIYWLGLLLGLVLAAGTLGLYRLGLRQLALVRQQQAFVAAVSHGLKTPLTSIRMYAEMLREGWVTDDKRDRYYRYIHDESERLSRLVTNVLQLARMSRDELRVRPRTLALSELIDQARTALASLTAQTGFDLVFDCADDTLVGADPDALTQVLINLVDNAIKFSAKARVKRIEIGCRVGAEPHGRQGWHQGVRIWVRIWVRIRARARVGVRIWGRALSNGAGSQYATMVQVSRRRSADASSSCFNVWSRSLPATLRAPVSAWRWCG